MDTEVETWIGGLTADLPDPDAEGSIESLQRIARVAFTVHSFYSCAAEARGLRSAGWINEAAQKEGLCERLRAQLISWGFKGLA